MTKADKVFQIGKTTIEQKTTKVSAKRGKDQSGEQILKSHATIMRLRQLLPLAIILLGIDFPIERAHSEESDSCNEEKGPCCELDWKGQGATIVKMQGEVLVSQSPYVDATLGMRVNNGGRVLTLDRSSAVAAFDDGCWHVLKENELLTIGDVSPCCAAAMPATAPVPLVPPPSLPSPFSSALAPLAPLTVVPAIIGAGVLTNGSGSTNTPDQGTNRPSISP